MKFLLIMVNVFLAIKSFAQAHVPNSFKETYDKRFPSLHYSYEPTTQTHNYSCNWDIDGDGKPDSLFFTGNGGAHLYFHLRLGLSSEHTTRDFPYLVTDFPMLDSVSYFIRMYGRYPNFPKFLVYDFNKDGKIDIFMNTDTSFSPIPAAWRKRGVHSGNIVISYVNRDINIKNFQGISVMQ